MPVKQSKFFSYCLSAACLWLLSWQVLAGPNVPQESASSNRITPPSFSLADNQPMPNARQQFTAQCYSPALVTVPEYAITSSPIDVVQVVADAANIVTNQTADFSGDVQIINQDTNIFAQQAQVNNNGLQVLATGDVSFISPQIKVLSEKIELDTQNAAFAMTSAQYQLGSLAGRGDAENIRLSAAEGIVLDEVSFTTCPLNNNDWAIKASEINLGQTGNLGQAYNTRFFVKGVPVMYLPYFAFPVTSARQSGLLFPKISSSSENGIDITQPYYFNLAANYDATVAPRLLTNRGLMLETELRHLNAASSSTIKLEYLPSDDETNGDERYFVRLQHQAQLSEHWFVDIDFNEISDANYIVDFGSDFFNRADTYVQQNLRLDYLSESLTASLRLADFTVLGEQTNNYRALPELTVSYSHPLNQQWLFNLDSEITYFTNTNNALPEASRFHVHPTIAYRENQDAFEFNAQLGLLSTYYEQHNLNIDVADNALDSNMQNTFNGLRVENLAATKQRNIGQAKLFGALFFERPQTLTGANSIVTLEPKIQYLYTSFADQSDIGLYDSAPLLNTVSGLFRGQEFTGLDRIVDNNQLTVALSSRFLDANNIERASVSLGQIFYFADSKVLAEERSNARSSVAAEFDFRISSRWFVDSQLQLAAQTDKVERSSLSLEYRRDANSLVQLSQRYIRDLSNETINQLGVSATWPINKNWQWAGRWYKDQELNRTIESYFGLEYESCCWALRVVAYRQLANRFALDDISTQAEFDSGAALQFRFKGISSQNNSTSMLRNGMFGYRQAYSIH